MLKRENMGTFHILSPQVLTITITTTPQARYLYRDLVLNYSPSKQGKGPEPLKKDGWQRGQLKRKKAKVQNKRDRMQTQEAMM